MHKKKGAIFVMPRSSNDWKGADALWITVAGWAAAFEDKHNGKAWVATTNKVLSVNETLQLTGRKSVNKLPSGVSALIPLLFKQGFKDVKLFFEKPTVWPIEKRGEWDEYDIQFIWEQHDLFAGVGKKLASKYAIPLVTFVHAPIVWEMKKWGVNRYFWGSILERLSEKKALLQATIVSCVSQQVKDKVVSMGIASEQTIVSPMAVNESVFKHIKPLSISVDKPIIIGWMGSFRQFHGLDIVLEAVAEIVKTCHKQIIFQLVGDGLGLNDLKTKAAQLGIEGQVVFLGKKAFLEIPAIVENFDICIVSADKAADFHYSPLKLREFLAAGRACIAPNAGDLPKEFIDGKELFLYNVGNVQHLTSLLNTLITNDHLRLAMGEAGKTKISKMGTWQIELQKVEDKLAAMYAAK